MPPDWPGSDLLDLLPRDGRETLAHGAVVLRGRAQAAAGSLLAEVARVAESAPFRHMTTPGGHVMSVAMTSCGALGWVSDRRGYRYTAADPMTGRPWPKLPAMLLDLASQAASEAGFADFVPDSCLVNRYEPGTRLSLHQDRNERATDQPVVSISLGLPATFLFGGLRRTDRPFRVRLVSGDVVVWGGPSRLAYHGVDPLAPGWHPATGASRINLTLRRAG